MSELIFPLFQWLEQSALAALMRDSDRLMALCAVAHLAGLCLLVGSRLLIDLRVLNLGLTRLSVGQVASDTDPWFRTGLAVLLVSGLCQLAPEAASMFGTGAFRTKFWALAGALGFHVIVYRKTLARYELEQRSAPWTGQLAAAVSLTLWLLVMLGGRWLAVR